MAPPGQLSDLQKERLRVCKALLQQEGGAFEGSADIKSWVRYAECTTALHQLATGPDGGPRTDLSLGQQLEACVLFIHILLNRAVVGLGVNEAMAAVITAAAQRLYMGLEGWEPVALGTYAGSEVPEGDVIKYGEVRRVIQEALRRMDAAPAEAAALPQRLAAAGCRVASLTAKQLRAALHLRLYEAATAVQDLYVSTCARSGLPWPEGPPPMEEAAAAARVLVRLQPGNAWWHLLEARVYLGNNQVGKAAPVLEAALAAAAQRKAHYWHAQAASNMGLALMSGANGSCMYDVSRVRDHFAQAQDGLRLSKKWVAKDVLDEVKATVADLQRQLEEQVARGPPGAARLPATMHVDPTIDTTPRPECAHCKERDVLLLKCARCKQVSYCSKECQAQHWSKGGHKVECKVLKAQAQQAQEQQQAQQAEQQQQQERQRREQEEEDE